MPDTSGVRMVSDSVVGYLHLLLTLHQLELLHQGNLYGSLNTDVFNYITHQEEEKASVE